MSKAQSKAHRNAGLDPEVDYEQISRNLALFDFPWDTVQALSFALFRTYAVPSIGRLLDRTGAFTGSTQKRYDDTALLLEVPGVAGLDSPDGKAAIRRINQMHRHYDIAEDDLRYVLATFVVVPRRWNQDYGWRPLTPGEVRASVRYYQELGRRMGIRRIPESYDDFARLMDDYERARFGHDEGARRVADATLGLLTTFYPRPLRGAVTVFARALMDEALLDAFDYPRPRPATRRLARTALRARARMVALLPPRRKPAYVRDMPRIKSYPHGFAVERLGTFPGGCPVHQPEGR